MSTEQQTYSIERQSLANHAYAASRGYDIVRTYADEGVSGLTLERREGLKQLLADVVSGAADYQLVLIYDVSRWGRFQDPDQAAHYEFICREAGVRIEYCAEVFEACEGMAANLLKQIKRAMAAEYSRELSHKVSEAKLGLARKGYWQCGAPGYGLRRMAVSEDGEHLQVMESGERKALQGWRTVLVPGPPNEVATVRQIYRLFVVAGRSWRGIARELNAQHVPASDGGPWTPARVKGVLTNEKYAGVYVFGRTRERFRNRRTIRSQDWVRTPGALQPIVSPGMFSLAQQMRRWKATVSDEELLGELRQVWRDAGRLNAASIKAHHGAHCPSVYARRFGDLPAAYARIGYEPSHAQVRRAQGAACARGLRRPRPASSWSDDQMVGLLRDLLAAHGRLTATLVASNPAGPPLSEYQKRFGGMAELYRLCGYQPTERQLAVIRRRGGKPSAGAEQTQP